jgi:hypothetical protein
LKLDGFALPIGLTLDEVIVSGHDVVVDADPFSIHLGRDASAVVRVSCESIANFLGSLKLGLRDVSVSTFEGQLKVGATAVVLVPIRATALCSLAVRDGKALDIVLHSAEPSAARGLIEKQLAGINPVLDLSTLPLDLVIEGVEIADGWVEVRGVGREG